MCRIKITKRSGTLKSEFAQYKDNLNKQHPGFNLGRTIQALAMGRGDLIKSRNYAQEHFKDMPWMEGFFTKAAINPGTTGDVTWAAPIALPTPLGAELVRLLYPTDLLLQLLARGARRLPFNCLFPRTNVGASTGWVASNKPTPATRQTLDTLSLGIYKTQGITVLTQELARSTLLDVASAIGLDMAQSLAAFRNKAAFDPDSPGVIGESPQSLTWGLNQIQSSGVTIAALTADAGIAMRQLTDAGVPLANAVWVTSERLAAHISLLRTTTGAAAFPTVSATGGEWFGLPMLTSGAEIESNSPSETFFTLLDCGSVAIAQDDQPTLDIAKSATMQLVDNPQTGATSVVSLWQMNLLAVRATMPVSFIRRRDVAVAIVRGVNI
jgi:HK97 family phage major capsid protein